MNITTLNDYKRKGLIKNQKHPTLPLLIWNYAEKVQFLKDYWDDITSVCRALITDTDGNVIARSFPKFFNIEENKHEPTTDFVIQDKLDGSLGVLFHYANEWRIASRGSFTSEQAIKAKQMLDTKYSTKYLDESRSYIFEIIYPENRIVVDYGEREELVYLASFSPSGEEHFNVDAVKASGFPIVKEYSGLDYKSIKTLDWENAEGFVVRFSNGSRVKIKFENYVSLHRVVTNLSTLGVWTWFKTGKDISEFVEKVPDEWHDWLRQTWNDIKTRADAVKDDAIKTYKAFEHLPTRRDLAHAIIERPDKKLVFALKDGQDIHERVCDMIRPKPTSMQMQAKPTLKKMEEDFKIPSGPGKLIILSGISGSGKSSWARQYVRDHNNAVIVSRDSIRQMTWGDHGREYHVHPDLHSREIEVTRLEYDLIQGHLDNGKTTIVDDTNVSTRIVNAILKRFANYSISFHVMETDIETAIERDRKRDKSVGAEVIQDQDAKKRMLHRHFDFSDRKPLQPAMIEIDADLPSAFVFDVDGTLAENSSGRHAFDWRRVGSDIVRDCVKRCLISLKASGYPIIICSGRDAVCRDITHNWLDSNEIPFDELLMRPEGDIRPDFEIKEELWRDLAKRYQIVALFDDRQQVVDHGRRLGLEMFQVAPGNF